MKKYVALMLIFLLGCNLSVSRAEEKTLTIATNNYYAMMETMEQFEQGKRHQHHLRKVRRHHGHDFDRLRYQESRH